MKSVHFRIALSLVGTIILLVDLKAPQVTAVVEYPTRVHVGRGRTSSAIQSAGREIIEAVDATPVDDRAPLNLTSSGTANQSGSGRGSAIVRLARPSHRDRTHRTHRPELDLKEDGIRIEFEIDRKWWEGPNICIRTSQVREEQPEEETAELIFHHRFTMSAICDDTGTTFKCVTIRGYNGQVNRTTRIHECCHGYQRRDNGFGCNQALDMKNLMQVIETLGNSELVQAVDSMNLRDKLTSDNLTIFAPKNSAFVTIKPSINMSSNNVLEITPDLVNIAVGMSDLLSAHIVEGFVRSSDFYDGQLLQTADADALIRINVYDFPRKALTANCVPITSTDNLATNGVVHSVDGLLEPVTLTLMDIISQTPELSTLKQIVIQNGLMDLLRSRSANGMTLFAPTNLAFEKLSPDLRGNLTSANKCFANIIKHHMFSSIICSASLEGMSRRRNILDNFVSLKQTSDPDLGDQYSIEQASITRFNIMGQNGVIHLIDSVLMPDEALNIMQVAENAGATDMLRLMEAADLTETLRSLSNFTIFLPTNQAFKDLSSDMIESLAKDPQQLTDLLKYHIVPQIIQYRDLENNMQLQILNGSKLIDFNVYHSFPFSHLLLKTAQCVPIYTTELPCCGGVAHMVTKVLMPPTGNLLDLLGQRHEFSQFVSLVKSINFADELQNLNRVTLFAPTNQAFASLPRGTLEDWKTNKEKAKRVVQHHLLSVTLCCSGVFENQWILSPTERTLDGRLVRMDRRRNHVTINGITVQSCDMMATNGVLHSLNQFLPESLAAGGNHGRRHGHRLSNSWNHPNRRRPIWEDERFRTDDGDDDDDLDLGFIDLSK